MAECARRYGSNKATKEVVGVVVEVRTIRTTTDRLSTIIIADYDFGDNIIKRKALNIRSLISIPTNPTNSAETSPTQPTTQEATGTARGEPAVDLTPSIPRTVAYCHGCHWIEDDQKTLDDVNGPVPNRRWAVRTSFAGETISAGGDFQGSLSHLEYFLLMFPPSQLNLMHRLMIEEIQKIAVANNVIHQDMTKGELLKFFGILILSTRFEFSARASLWSTTAPYKYVPAPAFGKKGMSRHRFDLLFRCLRFGEQPSVQPPEMSHKRFRWLLVDDFVTNFNTHREALLYIIYCRCPTFLTSPGGG
jgi:hypothetical protein